MAVDEASNLDEYWLRARNSALPYCHELFGVSVESVTCADCGYMPRNHCVSPRRAYRAHLKKHHPLTFIMTGKGLYMIHEDVDLVEPEHV